MKKKSVYQKPESIVVDGMINCEPLLPTSIPEFIEDVNVEDANHVQDY